jgi:PAS domain-containing protein
MSLSMPLPSGPAAFADRPEAATGEMASMANMANMASMAGMADIAELPASDPSWRRWADALPDICLWLDPNSGRIVDCNRAMFGSLGYTRSEVCGRPLHAFAEPRHLELAASTWQQLAHGGA